MSRGPRRLRKPDVAVLEGVLMARSMSVAACQCGAVYVRLHDRTGAIFAAGSVDRRTALLVADELCDAAANGGGAGDEPCHH